MVNQWTLSLCWLLHTMLKFPLVPVIDGAMWGCREGVLATSKLFRGGCSSTVWCRHSCYGPRQWIPYQGSQRAVPRGRGSRYHFRGLFYLFWVWKLIICTDTAMYVCAFKSDWPLHCDKCQNWEFKKRKNKPGVMFLLELFSSLFLHRS